MIVGKNILVRTENTQEPIVRNINFSAPKGSAVVFIGKSGAGKTTLLKTIAQLNTSVEGEISFDDRPLACLEAKERAATIGFVFQEFNLFPMMTVLQNCIDPLLIRGISRNDATKKALYYLAALDMALYKDRYPKQLSGGQQQRVAIARALCLEPKVLLLDEPTSSLDPENTQRLITLLKKLCQRGTTLLISSQDMSFVQLIADKVYMLDEGCIIEYVEKNNEKEFLESIKKFWQTRACGKS